MRRVGPGANGGGRRGRKPHVDLRHLDAKPAGGDGRCRVQRSAGAPAARDNPCMNPTSSDILTGNVRDLSRTPLAELIRQRAEAERATRESVESAEFNSTV